MARFVFNLPDIGEGIAEAEIVGWHIKIGDRIEEDQPIADMMTDKATVEMESPVSGTVVALAGEVGDVIAIGAMLVTIETDGEDTGDVPHVTGDSLPDAPADAMPVSEASFDAETPGVPEVTAAEPAPVADTPAETVATKPAASPASAQVAASSAAHVKVLASPAVRARAMDLGIDLSQV